MALPLFWEMLTALGASGAAGGIVRAVVEDARTANIVTLPFTCRQVPLGWFGDALVGACAAVVGYTFFNVLGDPSGELHAASIRAVGFGIASGYAGTRILNAMLEKFPQEKLDILAAKQEALRLIDSKKYGLAARKFREVLARAPEDVQAKANLALALSYTGPQGEAEAVRLLEEVVRIAPGNDEAWYNLACIRAVLSNPHCLDESVLDALEKAINLNEDWRAYVKTDSDFNRFRRPDACARYQQITGDTLTKPLS